MTTFNANTTLAGRHVLAEELLYVLEAWKHEDDWGVPSYPYEDTVLMLLACLHDGDNPRALRLIAKLAYGWKRDIVIKHIPTFAAYEAAERQAR